MSTTLPHFTGPTRCRHFGPCGGCQTLDRPYAEELQEKHDELTAQLRRYPELADLEVQPVLGARHPLAYRTSLKVPFARSEGRPVCGFFEPGSHRIVDLHECHIQHPLLVELLQTTRELAHEFDVPIYDEGRHQGTLRHLVARVGHDGREALVALVVRRAGARRLRKLAELLRDRFRSRGLVGVLENTNAKVTNAILGPETRTLFGRPFLRESVDGLNLESSLASFAQSNNEQACVLYGLVLEGLGDVTNRHVADLYSGAGPLALRLAQAGAKVTAVERHPAAAHEGRRNAAGNGLAKNLRFLVADTAAGLRKIPADSLEAAVVDPPRKGLDKAVIDQLLEADLERLVYVSCSPKSLARDLHRLHEHLQVKRIQPIDLFPRTHHLETVVHLGGAGKKER